MTMAQSRRHFLNLSRSIGVLKFKKTFIFGDDINYKVNLCYNVNYYEWTFKKLPDNTNYKFYQCSASIASSSKKILITGRGFPPKKDGRFTLYQRMRS
jgi:hypothetical protein